MHEEIQSVIEIIRPALQADGGDISLVSFDLDSGVVEVSLHGACVGCASSTITMKAGVERILKDRVPAVTKVVQIEVESDMDWGEEACHTTPGLNGQN